jgi:glycosyltransferase involved in cell wall biosynthesis
MLGGTNPALVKALGYGNMILALDTAFNREVIRDYGLYFSKNAQDLMARLQYVEENPGMVEEYRRRAPQRIREAYTWDHIVDQYEELFTQLANGEDPTRVHSSVREAPEYAMAGLASAGSAADD